MLTRVDHIDLRVQDLEAAIAFLGRLGLAVVRGTDALQGPVAMALPGKGQVVFELREDTSLSATTLDHVAFASDALNADVGDLAARGIEVTRWPTAIAYSGRTVANVADPSGTPWQLAD